ncbi:hypothetical protein B7P43_G17107 [Cryptotermes secundus]|nr:hypothetical protein B7P43_G17107 [Cryptotermes secundus]
MWHKLVIHTNSVQDLMLLVFLDCTNDELKRVHDEMKIFFTSGEGMKCHVTSVYIRDMNNRDTKVTALDLVLGEPCLEDTVAGLKLQLPPIKHLWNSVHGAETLCKVMEELLAPTKKTTVLEIGCGIGLVGLHLSKVAGEVLSVDTESTMEVAKKNAANNGITHCKYFGGKSEDMIQELVKEQTCDEICAVVMFCRNRSYKIVTALEQLRKVQHLNRLVLVEDKAFTFNTIQSLSALSNEKEMGNPFFPVKVAPVDWPNSKGYLLLFLLERIGRDDMGTFQMNDKSVPRKSEVHRKASASKKRYIRGKQGGRHLLPTSVWDRTVFLQPSCDVGPEIRAGTAHNSLFENTASNMQLQVAEEIQRAYFGAVGNVENVADKFYLREIMIENQRRQMEEEQRRQMEEVRIRQIQEEELNRRMLEAKRRQIQVEEEDWVRQVQEEEQRRRIRDEDWMRCIQENERRRQIEEEERRKIQEEEWRRQIQEEERKIHEEHRRRLQEEEWRRRIQEEEWRRPLLEELQKREMLTEERKRQIEEEWMSQMRGENYRGPVLEEAYRGQMEEERERKLVRMSSNLRSRNDMVEDLIADSLREAAIPQLSADAAQKVKHLVAEAIRSVGVANQDKRHDVSTSRGVGGIHPESTVSRFGRPDKEMPEAGVFEGGYSRQVKEVDYLHESRHDMYGGALQKHSFEQDDLKSQQYSLIRNQKISSETSLNLPSILDLKLKPPEVTGASSSDMQHLSRNPRISSETSLNLPSIFDLKLKPPELIGASSSDMQHPEDKCFLEVGNQRHGQVLTAQNELDINVTRGQQAGRFSTAAVQDVGSARRDRKPREFNAHMQLDRLADKQAADIFKRRSDLF